MCEMHRQYLIFIFYLFASNPVANTNGSSISFFLLPFVHILHASSEKVFTKPDDLSYNTNLTSSNKFAGSWNDSNEIDVNIILKNTSSVNTASLRVPEVTTTDGNSMENLNTSRDPIKLTMRQGLLLNQILGVYALDNVRDELCRNHTKEYRTGLRAFEPWALQMFDSSTKLQAGVLLGHLIDFGSFSQCLQIIRDTDSGPLYGKHCLVKIKPSMKLVEKVMTFRNISHTRFLKVYQTIEMTEIGWSICIPHSCPREDIFRHLNKTIMDVGEGLDLKVVVDEHYCNYVLNQPVMGRTQYVVLTFFALFLFIGLLAGIFDVKYNNVSDSFFLDTFSAYRNFQRVIRLGTGKNELDFLHGLRIMSSCYVVIGHRYIMYVMFPVDNQLEQLDWIVRYSSTLILGSTVSVDSFFMTSGMLVSLGFFEYVTKAGSFNIYLFYLHRYLRITLPLSTVVLFYTSLPQFLGSGPVLYDVYENHQKHCQDYWWSTLLHIQAYVNPDKLCIYPIWYLSNEIPFFFLSPVILYPLWKMPYLGYSIVLVLFSFSMVSSFYFAWINKYNGEMLPITNQLFKTQYFSKYYIQPHIRAAPYIIGLLFGYAVFHTRNRTYNISAKLNILLWTISAILMITAMFGCHVFYVPEHAYNRLESTIYLTFSRSAWTLGLAWIMWACMNGYGGMLNDFLSAHIFKALSRITYGIFLLHSIIQVYKCGTAKEPMTFSNVNAVYDALADLFAVFIVALLFTIFYELPLIKAEGFLFKPRSGNKKINPGK